MDYEQILREQRDDIVVLTLNRPEKLNAWTPRMSAELADPTPQLRWIKQLITRNASETDPLVAQRREVAALQQAYATPEHKEAVAAFLEKRKPVFR